MNQSYLFSFLDKTNGNHTNELSTIDHVNSEQHCRSTFKLSEIVNNCGLKRQTVCQIVRVISRFSPKKYIEL